MVYNGIHRTRPRAAGVRSSQWAMAVAGRRPLLVFLTSKDGGRNIASGSPYMLIGGVRKNKRLYANSRASQGE